MALSRDRLDDRKHDCVCLFVCVPQGAASMMVITNSRQPGLFIFLGQVREGYFIWL